MIRTLRLTAHGIYSPLHITERWPLFGLIGSVAYRYTGHRLSLIRVTSFEEAITQRSAPHYAALLQRLDVKQEDCCDL